MADEQIQLIEPTDRLAGEYAAFAAECRAESDNDHIHGAGVFQAVGKEDFTSLVKLSADRAKGVNLPDGFVPDSTFWLVRGERILGTVNLRHELTDYLRHSGGHIGYTIRPSQRGKGLATVMLKLTLEKACSMGIGRALVTCDKENIGSARVVQKNGGLLESEGLDPTDGKIMQRYWIEL